MRLFQNSGLYPAYLTRLNRLAAGATTFAQRRQAFLSDRFGASHFLKPVVDHAPAGLVVVAATTLVTDDVPAWSSVARCTSKFVASLPPKESSWLQASPSHPS